MPGKASVKCMYCGTNFEAYPSCNRKFCNRECSYKHKSKKHNPEGYQQKPHLTELNRKLNPHRMTNKTRMKLRKARLNRGQGKSYEKTFGRHTHRIAAERKLGRSLEEGEVVHHIDKNIRNNHPDNLMVFASQKEHAAYHIEEKKRTLGSVLRRQVMPR